jgi:integrase
MLKFDSMLTIYRRHTPTCPHRHKGREYLKCDCPLWADGYVNGKRTLRQSLKTRDIARARKRAVAIESPDASTISKILREAVAAFLVNCEHLGANTQRKYRNRLERQLVPFCEARGIDVVSEVTLPVLDDFRASRKLSPTTSALELGTLQQFFAFCVDRHWITDNLAKRIKPPRNIKPTAVVPYTADEISRMLKACQSIGRSDYERKRTRAMLILMRHTALRISDVVLLERSRVDRGEILLHTRKTGATVRLPITRELQAALEELPPPRGGSGSGESRYFFMSGVGSARSALTAADRVLRKVFRLSGVKDAHAHRFRHTLATEILANGGTLTDVADVLGISETIARKHYAKWSQARQDRITSILRSIHLGTKRVHTLKLVRK